jgi:hypothetical protein
MHIVRDYSIVFSSTRTRVGEWWDWGLGAESIPLVVFIQLTPYNNPRIASCPRSLVP